jgi:enamine deaminase RidA (YjgF/YER057c/UK114 family)
MSRRTTVDAAGERGHRAAQASRYVNPPALAAPQGFSHGVRFEPGAGALLFVAGQIGWTLDGRMVAADFVAQFDQALANVLAVVEAAGGDARAVGQMTIFVVDRTEYVAARRALGAVYRARMGRHYPAMSLVEVKGLLEAEARVEIEAIAVVPSGAARSPDADAFDLPL